MSEGSSRTSKLIDTFVLTPFVGRRIMLISRSFEVEMKTPKGKVYTLVINDLFESIVPEESFVKVLMYFS